MGQSSFFFVPLQIKNWVQWLQILFSTGVGEHFVKTVHELELSVTYPPYSPVRQRYSLETSWERFSSSRCSQLLILYTSSHVTKQSENTVQIGYTILQHSSRHLYALLCAESCDTLSTIVDFLQVCLLCRHSINMMAHCIIVALLLDDTWHTLLIWTIFFNFSEMVILQICEDPLPRASANRTYFCMLVMYIEKKAAPRPSQPTYHCTKHLQTFACPALSFTSWRFPFHH